MKLRTRQNVSYALKKTRSKKATNVAKSPVVANLPPMSSPRRTRKHADDAPVFGTEMITVWVGNDITGITSFTVHKPLLIVQSDFFEAALQSVWQEGQNGIVDLPASEPAAFNAFVQFVYTGAIFSQVTTDQQHSFVANIGCDPEWEHLARCYVLGETLLAANFKDAVITAIIEKSTATATFPSGLAKYVYANTYDGSKLRRLIVDFHVDCSAACLLKDGNTCEDKVHGGKDFLADVLARVLEAPEKLHDKEKILPWVENPCQYHEHVADTCER